MALTPSTATTAEPEPGLDRPGRLAAQGWDALWPAGVPRRGRLRVRALTNLRWVAIAGQTITSVVVA